MSAQIARFCIVLMLWTAQLPALPQQSPKPSPEDALKSKLIEIPNGSVVEVRLKDKQKIRGKLGKLSDTGFELQTLKDGRIENRSIALSDVKSVKFQEKGMGTGAKITLGILAGLGIFFVVLIAIAAGHGFDS